MYDWVDRLVCWIQWLTDLHSKSKKLLIVLTDIWRKNILLLRSNPFIYNNPVNGPLSTMSCASQYQKNKAVNHRRQTRLHVAIWGVTINHTPFYCRYVYTSAACNGYSCTPSPRVSMTLTASAWQRRRAASACVQI